MFSELYVWLIVIFLFYFFTIVISRASSKKRRNKAKSYLGLKYQRKPLMSPAERSFYGVLSEAVSDSHIVFCKVRVSDVLKPVVNKSDWYKAFNPISMKHFDFVLCCPGKLSVDLVVELDDKTHKNNDKVKKSDVLKDYVCKSAGIPLVRFPVLSAYSVNSIKYGLFKKDEQEIALEDDFVMGSTEIDLTEVR